MCGIFAHILNHCQDSSHCHKAKENVLRSRLSSRGPDVQNFIEEKLMNSKCAIFYGSTLHFKGCLTTQPLCDGTGNILLWNGEIFHGLDILESENDGAVLLSRLHGCCSEEEIVAVMETLQGPWAFIYWQAKLNKLWFGRDFFGRRSLLFHRENNGDVILASISVKPWNPWIEVSAVGIYCLDLSSETGQSQTVTLYPWSKPEHLNEAHSNLIYNETLMSRGNLLGVDLNVKVSKMMMHPCVKAFCVMIGDVDNVPRVYEDAGNLEKLATGEQNKLCLELIKVLEVAVRTRTSYQSLKCSMCIQKELRTHLVDGCGVEISHSFSQSVSVTGDTISLVKNTNISDVKNKTNNPEEIADQNHFQEIECHSVHSKQYGENTSELSQSNEEMLESIKVEHVNIGHLAQSESTACGHSRVAVLFSGGIDSLMIAALADRTVDPTEPIDLLNVAFQQQISHSKNHGKFTTNESSYLVPDRITGHEGLEQLNTLNPRRQWNFVEIDISTTELQEKRVECVRDLVYPLSTVLDDSIGCAIWFAARGQGNLVEKSGKRTAYTSTARVVLVGMGADEQLVGYSRHRGIFSNEGWSGLVAEIQMEIERISSRNLGRDDRVISDHGREARFPFLDENVVSFLNQLPLHQKANLYLPRGIGEKFLLRLAAEKLGLTKGALAPKRAIQFGSRIAKSENRKEKGSDLCDRLTE